MEIHRRHRPSYYHRARSKSLSLPMAAAAPAGPLFLGILILLLSSPRAAVAAAAGEKATVSVRAVTAISHTDDNFICATLDWWPKDKCNYGMCPWHDSSILNLDLYNPILYNAVKAFRSLRIRLGGSMQDQVTYKVGKHYDDCHNFRREDGRLFGFTAGCLPMNRWDELNIFFRRTNCKSFSIMATTRTEVDIGHGVRACQHDGDVRAERAAGPAEGHRQRQHPPRRRLGRPQRARPDALHREQGLPRGVVGAGQRAVRRWRGGQGEGGAVRERRAPAQEDGGEGVQRHGRRPSPQGPRAGRLLRRALVLRDAPRLRPRRRRRRHAPHLQPRLREGQGADQQGAGPVLPGQGGPDVQRHGGDGAGVRAVELGVGGRVRRRVQQRREGRVGQVRRQLLVPRPARHVLGVRHQGVLPAGPRRRQLLPPQHHHARPQPGLLRRPALGQAHGHGGPPDDRRRLAVPPLLRALLQGEARRHGAPHQPVQLDGVRRDGGRRYGPASAAAEAAGGGRRWGGMRRGEGGVPP